MNSNSLNFSSEVKLGILSEACVWAASFVGHYMIYGDFAMHKVMLCFNVYKEAQTFAFTMMILHAVLYAAASRLQFQKTHHFWFYLWQLVKPLFLVFFISSIT